MKYEKEFQAFYNKYSKLYNEDKGYHQSTKYNLPYYNYIVQPQDKYKEPFIHASKFNNDRLTEKIGYEKQEPFPFQHFRMSTPLYGPQEIDQSLQRQINAYEPQIQNVSNRYDDYEKRYYNNFIKQKENQGLYFPQHVVDYSVTPSNESQMKTNANHYHNNNSVSYSQNNNDFKGLSPIQIKSINKHTLSINPYTDKDINIGETNLSKNPIVYPLDVEKVVSKKMFSQSPRLGSVGSAIIHS